MLTKHPTSSIDASDSGTIDIPDRSTDDDSDQLWTIAQTLSKLHGKAAQAMLWHHYDDMPMSSVASLLGLKPAEAKAMIENGISELRGSAA